MGPAWYWVQCGGDAVGVWGLCRNTQAALNAAGKLLVQWGLGGELLNQSGWLAGVCMSDSEQNGRGCQPRVLKGCIVRLHGTVTSVYLERPGAHRRACWLQRGFELPGDLFRWCIVVTKMP
jgi:hypothetical protein